MWGSTHCCVRARYLLERGPQAALDWSEWMHPHADASRAPLARVSPNPRRTLKSRIAASSSQDERHYLRLVSWNEEPIALREVAVISSGYAVPIGLLFHVSRQYSWPRVLPRKELSEAAPILPGAILPVAALRGSRRVRAGSSRGPRSFGGNPEPPKDLAAPIP